MKTHLPPTLHLSRRDLGGFGTGELQLVRASHSAWLSGPTSAHVTADVIDYGTLFTYRDFLEISSLYVVLIIEVFGYSSTASLPPPYEIAHRGNRKPSFPTTASQSLWKETKEPIPTREIMPGMKREPRLPPVFYGQRISDPGCPFF